MTRKALMTLGLCAAACGGGPAAIQVMSARQANGLPDLLDNDLQLEVQLTNTGNMALPLDSQLFAVKTRSGLLIHPRLFTTALRFAGGSTVAPAAELAPGGSFSFGLAFDTLPGDVSELDFT